MEWFSVNDRLPPENEPVIVTATHLGERSFVWFAVYRGTEHDEMKWWNIENTNSYGDYPDLYNVTHWMPQPEPATTPQEAAQ